MLVPSYIKIPIVVICSSWRLRNIRSHVFIKFFHLLYMFVGLFNAIHFPLDYVWYVVQVSFSMWKRDFRFWNFTHSSTIWFHYMQFIFSVLPSMNEFCGSFFQSFMNGENCNNRWNSNQHYLPCKNDSKTSSTTSSYGPKNIFSNWFSIKNPSIYIYKVSINMICC